MSLNDATLPLSAVLQNAIDRKEVPADLLERVVGALQASEQSQGVLSPAIEIIADVDGNESKHLPDGATRAVLSEVTRWWNERDGSETLAEFQAIAIEAAILAVEACEMANTTATPDQCAKESV